MPTIWTSSPCWHMSAHVDMPTCADMCQHVASLSASLMQTIWTLSACWYVSAHMDMPTWADLSRHVLTCAKMWHHSRHLWYQPFGPYLQAGMCQHMWTCRHVLICADICQHVPSLTASLIPTIWTLSCQPMSAHISTCRHAQMCWHVPACKVRFKWLLSEVLRVVSHVGTYRHMSAHIGTYQHMSACPQILTHASIQIRSKCSLSEVSRLMSHVGTCQHMACPNVLSQEGYHSLCKLLSDCAWINMFKPNVLTRASMQDEVQMVGIRGAKNGFTCWYIPAHVSTYRHISAHVGMSKCADTCQHAR